MGTHTFYADILVHVEFNDSDFELINESMEHHYDHAVKSSAQLGGFWYGFNNVRTWAKESKEEPDRNYNPNAILLDDRKLQLVLKSLEMNHSQQSSDITKRLYGILREMKKKWGEVNNQLNSLPL